MLPVLVSFALLALDASRRMNLQTQMQAAGDSLALAGARELNRQPRDRGHERHRAIFGHPGDNVKIFNLVQLYR